MKKIIAQTVGERICFTNQVIKLILLKFEADPT